MTYVVSKKRRHRSDERNFLVPFAIALVAGGMHATITLYWASGGRWLLWSLSPQIVRAFTGRMWLLYPLALLKGAGAVGPAWLAGRRWPCRTMTRLACWLAGIVLIFWGGLNTVIGNAVLLGVIRPAGGYDRSDMVGHAWMWDPLFLVWGIALLVGMSQTRRCGAVSRLRKGA